MRFYIAIQTAPNLWTVGHGDEKYGWIPESDHLSPTDAENRAKHLNEKKTKLYEFFYVHRSGAVRTLAPLHAKALYDSLIVLTETGHYVLALRLLIAETGLSLRETKPMIDEIKN